jgi:hypothetical protein
MINLVPQKQYYNEDGTIYVPQAADGLGSKGRSIVTGEELGLEPVLNYFDPQNVGFFTKTERRSDPNNRFSPIVTEYEWNPSKYDFSDLNLIKAPGGIAFQDRAIYENKDGIQLEYRPSTDTFLTPYTSDQLRDFQQNNPNQYNTILANNISEKIFGNWASNRNDLNQPLYDRLESFKEKTPEAYYTGKINLLSKQMGWNHGQNTFERAVPLQQELEKLIPEAQKVGVSQTEINNLYSGGFSEASSSNQNRIAREPGGFKLSELIRGVAPVAALAIGAPFLDAALSGSTAAASAAGTAGATAPTVAPTGSSLLSYVGLGAEGAAPFTAAPGLASNLFTVAPSVGTALPLSLGDDLAQLAQTYPNIPVEQLQSIAEINYGLNPTTAFDAANLAASGYNPATINQVLGYSYTPTELAGTGIESKALGLPSKGLTAGQALQGARLASGLLSGGQQQQQQPQQQMVQMPQQSIIPRGQVDYSGIYNLLNLQKAANPYSLLG